MLEESNTVRLSDPERTEKTSTHVVGFTCEGCRATMPVDSTTYEELLANGCVVCGSPVAASAFSRRETA